MASTKASRRPGRLVGAGSVLLVLAVVLEIIALFRDSTETITKDSTVTAVTTTKDVTSSTAPPTALITGLAGLGVVLILAGVFYDRITKITVAGVEIDLATHVAASAAAVSGGDAETARQLVDLVLGSGRGPADVTRRLDSRATPDDDLDPMQAFMATAIAQGLVKTPASWA